MPDPARWITGQGHRSITWEALDRTSKGAGNKRDMGCARSRVPVLRRAYGLAGLGALALRCVLSGPSPRAAANGQPAIQIPAAVIDDPGRGAGPGWPHLTTAARAAAPMMIAACA